MNVLQGCCKCDLGKNPRVSSRWDFKHTNKLDSKKQGCRLHLRSAPLLTSCNGHFLKLEKITALIPELLPANGKRKNVPWIVAGN